MTTTLELRLTPGPQAASAARIAMHELEERLSQELLAEVRLMVSELVTNSIRHGCANDLDPIALRAAIDDERLWVQVADGGPGFRHEIAPGAGSEAGGWGLYIVETLADRWGVGRNEGMASVWFEIDLRSRSNPRAEADHRGSEALGTEPARPNAIGGGAGSGGGGGDRAADNLRLATSSA